MTINKLNKTDILLKGDIMCYSCKIDGLNGFSKTETYSEYSNLYNIRYRIVKDLDNNKYYQMITVFDKSDNNLLLKNSIEINYCPYCGRAFK